MPIEERKIENVQTLVTLKERERIEAMAKSENRSISELVRIMLLESLEVWESSQAGRRRKK